MEPSTKVKNWYPWVRTPFPAITSAVWKFLFRKNLFVQKMVPSFPRCLFPITQRKYRGRLNLLASAWPGYELIAISKRTLSARTCLYCTPWPQPLIKYPWFLRQENLRGHPSGEQCPEFFLKPSNDSRIARGMRNNLRRSVAEEPSRQ